MSYRVLFALPTEDAAEEAVTLTTEGADFDLVDAVTSAGEVVEVLSTREYDAVVLHEDIGPLPVLDLARQLSARHPDIGLVLLAREQTAELYRAALTAGIRGIAKLPLSLEDLHTSLATAAAWSQSVRARVTAELDEAAAGGTGTMVAVAGGKGGVGATTLAVQLALCAQRSGRHRAVCLVDLDLQSGDVRSFLDLTHRRSLVDLLEVAEEITARHLEDSLYLHPSGLRILLPPQNGEHGEDVGSRPARLILGAIRSRFDVVVVDVGSVTTEAGAVAVEMANQVLVVVTPDVPALRGANRLVGLWERLQVRKDGVGVVINRASRESEIQPDLVAKVVNLPVAKVTVPADFRGLEAAANTGVPDRLEDGALRRSVEDLAVELKLVAVQAAPKRRRLGARSESGQGSVELVGMTATIFITIALLCQVVLVGYTYVLTSNSARAGARALAVGSDVEAAALEDVHGGWRDLIAQTPDLDPVQVNGSTVTVTLKVPPLLAIFDPDWRVSFDAGTHVEG